MRMRCVAALSGTGRTAARNRAMQCNAMQCGAVRCTALRCAGASYCNVYDSPDDAIAHDPIGPGQGMSFK